MRRRRRIGRVLIVAVLASLLATGAFGLTAANTVPDSRAGDGAGTVSGYTVSNVDYTLDATDPANIDQVAFDLDADPSGSDIQVKLVSTGSDWYTCSNTGVSVTCDTTSPQATVAAVDELRVVVAD